MLTCGGGPPAPPPPPQPNRWNVFLFQGGIVMFNFVDVALPFDDGVVTIRNVAPVFQHPKDWPENTTSVVVSPCTAGATMLLDPLCCSVFRLFHAQ